MTQTKAGETAHQTGDINLAAALMAVGIPLDRLRPVVVIESERFKRPYASFRITPASADGKHVTEAMMGHWSGGDPLEAWHPFAAVCDFINAKNAPRMTPQDWLDCAVDYLRELGVNLPGLRTIADVEPFVNALPRAAESYVLAFVANRALCIELCKMAIRSVHMTDGCANLMIDTNLPKWQQRELLSIFQG